MEHFGHEHPLALSKYNNSPQDKILCYVCNDPILENTDVYHCIHQSTTSQDSPCASFHLHKTCAHLPRKFQHHLHPEHVLILRENPYGYNCRICDHKLGGFFLYDCLDCYYEICTKCASLEREINHPSHNHELTLLPFKAILDICTACGTKGIEDFSYLCKTCLFWIHKSCASAPRELIHKDHHNDHPLVLAYSLPEQYRKYRVSCSLCPESIYDKYQVDLSSWLYYCAYCRYFAHVQCALSAPESAKDGEENDVDGSNVVHFPVSENELYQLIQQFANKFTISTEDAISECRNGHSLIRFDDFNDKRVVETNTSDKRICDGCVQPLLSTPDPFYGCLHCNFFLHNVCAAGLPRQIQEHIRFTRCQPSKFYACDFCDRFFNGIVYTADSHRYSSPKQELTRFTRRHLAGDPSEFYFCYFCGRFLNGIVYTADPHRYSVDIVCAALPSKIKHDSHRHTLHLLSDAGKYCRGCGKYLLSFGCEKCDYYIDITCALKPGTMKHRWDEHEVNLMYPPVKGHPHDFDCEFCSQDIDPNLWFYHCSKCDTSFHSDCIYPNGGDYNIKYGGIDRDDSVHEHNLKFTIAGRNYPGFKCGGWCGDYISEHPWKFECESCKFSICWGCFRRRREQPR